MDQRHYLADGNSAEPVDEGFQVTAERCVHIHATSPRLIHRY
jgi:hypothetical protein